GCGWGRPTAVGVGGPQPAVARDSTGRAALPTRGRPASRQKSDDPGRATSAFRAGTTRRTTAIAIRVTIDASNERGLGTYWPGTQRLVTPGQDARRPQRKEPRRPVGHPAKKPAIPR